MGIRNLLYSGGLALALAIPAYAQDNETKQSTSQVDVKKDQITEEEIEELMKRGSVDEILKEDYENGTIEHLVYDHENPEESGKSYKKFVFQEDLKPEDRKPVLVMFYSGDNDISKKEFVAEAQFREAIILKEIETLYGNKMNSLVFKVPYTDIKKASPYGVPLEKAIGTFVRGSPSLTLYGQFDLLKEETPEKNDGRIKHLDTLFGGPKENRFIIQWIYPKLGAIDWLDSNVIEPNGEYAVRINNSSPIKPVKIVYNSKND